MAPLVSRSIVDGLAKRWHARVPTREAIVVTAFLALVFELAYLGAFFVRGELLLRPSDSDMILSTIGWVVAIKLALFYWRGFCHRPWRAARFEDLNRLLRTATAALLVLVAFNYFAVTLDRQPIPRSVLLLDWVFTLIAVGGMQALARSIYEEIMPATAAGNERSVLVIDASPAGRDLALALAEHRPQRYFVAGLLDDDPEHYGTAVGRARVLGPVAMAPMCAERLRVGEIVVRENAIYGQRLRALCDACAAVKVRVRIAEDHTPVGRRTGQGASRTPKVRDIALHDLLSRPAAHLDDDDAHVAPFIAGRRVLVTGAGGSVGVELCRQLLRFRPARLTLVDRAEPSLSAVHATLAEPAATADVVLSPRLCDVADADRIEAVIAEEQPDVLIHAAAFKHVPLMEHHPLEAIENNTLATATLAELAADHGVATFVSLSTDKAVYPTSVMGASKLVAERYLEAVAAQSRTTFVIVRFGNVLESSGSVVPLFAERLRRHEPIVVTDRAARRSFLTGDEAAQLILLAGALGQQSGVYALDMGEPLEILELVNSLAFVMDIPADDVEIEYCGLRPGEKLTEDAFFGEESPEPTASPFVLRAMRPVRPLAEVQGWLAELREAMANGPEAAAARLIQISSVAVAGDPAVRPPAEPTKVAAS